MKSGRQQWLDRTEAPRKVILRQRQEIEEAEARIASLESQVSRMRAVVDAARELDSHVTRFWFQPPGEWWDGLHRALSSMGQEEK
jgi:hypothetical protein